MSTSTEVNPVCTNGSDLPPPPTIGADGDPAEPHPDEPGAPAFGIAGEAEPMPSKPRRS